VRRDISKVLVTTARYGSSWKNGEVRALRRERITEDYDGPRLTSMKPSTAGWDDRKQLNEYLNPLWRFLQRRCGTPWDDVYSEICRHNRRGSAVGEHIFQHLRDYVRVKISDVSHWFGPDFFVDGDGVLRRSPPREPWRKRPAPNSWRSTDDESVWHVRRGDGCWFEWRLVPLPDDSLERLLHRDREPSGFADGLPRSVGSYGVLRTLSRREKRDIGLV
jgi:hypothetical protein